MVAKKSTIKINKDNMAIDLDKPSLESKDSLTIKSLKGQLFQARLDKSTVQKENEILKDILSKVRKEIDTPKTSLENTESLSIGQFFKKTFLTKHFLVSFIFIFFLFKTAEYGTNSSNFNVNAIASHLKSVWSGITKVRINVPKE